MNNWSNWSRIYSKASKLVSKKRSTKAKMAVIAIGFVKKSVSCGRFRKSLAAARGQKTSMDPRRLVERIVSSRDPSSLRVSAMINRLLKEFQQGYPIDYLRDLLHSSNERLVNAAAWIACELGKSGEMLLDDVSPLLTSPSRGARYWAIECMLLWAGKSEESQLATVVSLIGDRESSVRWKAMDFIARASHVQLEAALSALEAKDSASPLVHGLKWLLIPESRDPETIKLWLNSNDSIGRKYGVVAARRISKDNIEPLFYALSVNDPDISKFARTSMNLL